MNGAESLVHSLLRSGVDTCFCNPGTSEMHFVAALDRIAGMHCVLGLFEGVVTGAADGWARGVSGWVRTTEGAATVGADAAAAVQAATTYPGQIATLILPS